MRLSKLALLFVVFVDVSGQGLLFPVVNTLLMDPTTGFLPAATPEAERHFDFGLLIGTFYLSWFLGAVYVSKLSDSIGRRWGLLLCLSGALIGYLLTILALAVGSFWLLLLGRVVTGFTSGNQPIAQAAMTDLSRDDAEKTRNLGYIVSAFSIGLLAGPLIAGLLTDQELLGGFASLSLPFYTALGLVIVAFILVACFYQEKLEARAPLRVGPLEVFLLLWKVASYPTVLRISAAFFFFMFVWNTFYVFVDNYLSSRFQVGTLGTSLAMLVAGAVLAFSSAFLVSAIGQRFSKRTIVAGAAGIMALSSLLIVVAPAAALVYVAIVPMAGAFAVGYATLLSLFSASVGKDEQGWVMGVSTALWTSGAGITSVIGGDLMGLDLHAPFLVAIASALVTLALIAILWRYDGVRQIAGKLAAAPE